MLPLDEQLKLEKETRKETESTVAKLKQLQAAQTKQMEEERKQREAESDGLKKEID